VHLRDDPMRVRFGAMKILMAKKNQKSKIAYSDL
jgi:hypothetical protein